MKEKEKKEKKEREIREAIPERYKYERASVRHKYFPRVYFSTQLKFLGGMSSHSRCEVFIFFLFNPLFSLSFPLAIGRGPLFFLLPILSHTCSVGY